MAKEQQVTGGRVMPVILEADKMGPVDVAVIAFEGSDFSGDVAPALADLQASGTVKVIDMAFVRKAADGSTSIVELADERVAGAFERLAGPQVELLSEADLSDLAGGGGPPTGPPGGGWGVRGGAPGAGGRPGATRPRGSV
jgi:hypothetical protein